MTALRTALLSLAVIALVVAPAFADVSPFPFRTYWPRQAVPNPTMTIVAGLFLSAALVAVGLRWRSWSASRQGSVILALAFLVVLVGVFEARRAHAIWDKSDRSPRGPRPDFQLPPPPEPPTE